MSGPVTSLEKDDCTAGPSLVGARQSRGGPEGGGSTPRGQAGEARATRSRSVQSLVVKVQEDLSREMGLLQS